jgi:competence protein ComEA
MELPALTLAHRRLLAAALLLVVAVLLAVHLLGRGAGGSTGSFVPVRPSGRARVAAAAPRVVVDVVGAVRRPGLYRLAPGTRVADAVAAAGGLAPRAERVGVNLAAPVSDGQQVVVPARGAAAAAGAAGGAPSSGPVSLSAATPEQLDALPGIGPSTAAKIVAFRQEHGAFHSVEELDAVPGIGPGRLAELKGLVVP